MYILSTGLWINMARYSTLSSFHMYHLTLLFKPVWMVKNSLTDIQIYLNPGLISSSRLLSSMLWVQVQAVLCVITSRPQRTRADDSHCCPWCHSSKFNFSFLSGLSLKGWYKFFTALYEWHDGKKGKMSSNSQKAKAKKFKGNNFKKVYN